MTTTILIIVNVFSALAIIVLALMQQSKGDMGSAFGGGGSQSMFGSRGSANFLSRTTAVMCAVFFISSLALAYTYSKNAESNSVLGGTSVLETVEQAADNEIPTFEGAADAVETQVEEATNEIPSVPDVEEAVEAGEAALQATDEVEFPTVPE